MMLLLFLIEKKNIDIIMNAVKFLANGQEAELMCTRYYYNRGVLEEFDIEIDEDYRNKSSWIDKGDVRPSDTAIVIASPKGKIQGIPMNWGISSLRDERKIHVNARSESVLERITFRESIIMRRCIIPARHFYEWDSNKNKVTFRKNEGVLLMAGCYTVYKDQYHFVILTTEANESVAPVHDRMPLIIEREEMSEWISNNSKLERFLFKSQPQLLRTVDYEQLSMFS